MSTPTNPVLSRTAHLTLAAALLAACAGQAHAQYVRTNLVSDQQGVAAHTDANLVNAWGVAFNPNGFVWVANNGTGLSTLYDGSGAPNSLIVNVPSTAAATGGNPTGMVFNGSTDFSVTSNNHSGAAAFLWATESGTIAGWNPNVPNTAPPASTQAFTAVTSTAGAVYKGLAISTGTAAGSPLYATDFHNNRVDMFNSTFAPITTPGAFTDPNLPAGYAPFNARNLNNQIYVTYALQDAAAHDDDPGAGHGFVDVYDTSGTLLRRLVSQGALNSPWGLAIAPSNFGPLSGDLLVGNFGDGHINAYNPTTGAFQGALSDAGGNPITIDGLWGFDFGNGLLNQPTNTLFFAAGPDGEAHGLYGRLDVPSPTGATVLAAAALSLPARRRRRS